MRSYDANRLWLVEEFGPGMLRNERKGIDFPEDNREEAKRMLISNFVIETVGNPCILQDWSCRPQDVAPVDQEEEAENDQEGKDDDNRQQEDVQEEENIKRCQIPGNREEAESFITFIDVGLETKGQESFSVLLNGHCCLPKLFRSSIAFKNTLRHWTNAGASQSLDHAMEIESECRTGAREENQKWQMIKKKMIDILLSSGSLTKTSSALDFSFGT
jgi:hypothetical protein